MILPSIEGGCRKLGLDLPVSAADLHKVYTVFVLNHFEHNSMNTPHWRGTCDCLELYGVDYPRQRQIITDHLVLLGLRFP
jgi:hypothetical protein